MSFFHCRIQYGLSHVVAVYEGTNPAISDYDDVDFRTGVVTLTGVFDVGVVAYTGTASEGSTDGTDTQDFKTEKANQVIKFSEFLESKGVLHNSQEFAANADIRSAVALAELSSLSKTSFTFYDIRGNPFTPASNGDFNAFRDAVATRWMNIYKDTGGGQGDLILQITAAANTQVAMDAIVDGRT